MRVEREKGIALITALLILFLVSAMVIGMCWMVMTDQRLGGNNKDRETAFYGAEAGMEKLTADMGSAFTTNGKLTAPQVAAIVANPPTTTTLPNIQFKNPSGTSTYGVAFTPNGTNGDPLATNATILPPSPYAGMQGLITQFTLNVAAQTISTGAEVKLQRQMQVVSIPVFQFGVYSDSDLAFFNGPNMTFGGRTHTNGNLWLTPSGQLNMGNKVTVVGQVLRQYLENGDYYTTGSYSGATYIALVPNPTNNPPSSSWRALAQTESSVTGFSEYGAVSTTPNSPTWANAVQAYNGMLENNVSQLSLTAAALGGITTPISLIRRAVPGEQGANPAEFNEQYFSEASIRILLDDYKTPGLPSSGCAQSDMMSLDTVTSTTPVDLTQLAFASNSPYQTTAPTSLSGQPLTGTANANGQVLPLPVSGASAAYIAPGTAGYNGYWEKAGYPTITGCLKIEVQNNTNGWTDVTAKILSQGYIGRNIDPLTAANLTTYPSPKLAPLPSGAMGAQGPTINTYVTGALTCADPSPNAIIRLARLRDNPSYATAANTCGNVSAGITVQATDVWPNVLFDPREGILRNSAPAGNYLTAAGVMNYVELDMKNLAAWIVANQATYGLNNNTTGFTIYFSDRRGEQYDPNASTTRTGSYGYNDIVNPSNQANGCPNTTLDQGEDLEGDGILRTYGGVETPPAPITPTSYVLPNVWNGSGYMSVSGTVVIMHGDSNCSSSPNRPDVGYNDPRDARVNPPLFFRRALKIVNGQSLNFGTSCGTVACGITIATENPVYVQGDFNAPPDGSWSGTNVAAAIAGDAFTILSDNWNDVNSFTSPYATTNRTGVQTAIRAAVISGKGIPFPEINGVQDFGTDGGVHNFLRYLEGWGSTLHYMGSLVSFFYNRQGVGTYKSSIVYGAPTRDYNFDTNFTLGPQYLPPNTPTLRSVNTTGFSQQLLPSQ